MKTTLAILLTVAAVAAPGVVAFASDDSVRDPVLRTMQARLEQQVERIKAARERADAQVGVAKDRSSAQLELSGEQLQRQIELLERFREDLQDRMQESRAAVDPSRNALPSAYASTVAEIDRQIGQTKSLVSALQSAADKLAAEQNESESAGAPCPGPQLWNSPCGTGAMAPSKTDPPRGVPSSAAKINLDSIPDRFDPSVVPATPPGR
ncbi:MAG: hypothetical protein HY914_10455 [Desulfomonile tiedjei]|nr:hypothetical protein [Desulfomonile tiedjei]